MAGEVKLTNAKSKIKPRETSISFEERADEIFKNSEALKEQATKVASDFVKLFDNKIISENRKELHKEIEQKVFNDCITLALALNTDETQPEGYGNVAWQILLAKMLLRQHYRINDLEYQIVKLQEFNKLQEKLK